MKSIYEISNLKFSYRLGKQNVVALQNVQASIPEKQFVCLTGPSGSGKTTLLSLLGLIEPIQDGEIQFAGKKFSTLTESEKNHLRKFDIGFVFQTFQLVPILKADENVEYFLIRQGLSQKERSKRVQESLEAVGLWSHRMKKPLEMSGGQRQRVAVARAIAKNPKVIIADEPTANLDQQTGKELMQLFRVLNTEKGISFIVSSHDPMVKTFAHQEIQLKDGKIVAQEKTHAAQTGVSQFI